MEVRHILVPVNFSPCCYEVAENAIEHASRLGGVKVTLLYVFEAPGLLLDAQIMPTPAAPAVAVGEYLDDQAKEQMAAYRSLDAGTVEVIHEIRHGDVVQVILESATELSADLIFMSTHGRRGLDRLLMGSITEEVIRQANIPVMAFRTLHKPQCVAKSCSECSDAPTAEQCAVQEALGRPAPNDPEGDKGTQQMVVL
jgi:nucleotide-binding universal stress UspA family protein